MMGSQVVIIEYTMIHFIAKCMWTPDNHTHCDTLVHVEHPIPELVHPLL